jgi:hypothetical protein
MNAIIQCVMKLSYIYPKNSHRFYSYQNIGKMCSNAEFCGTKRASFPHLARNQQRPLKQLAPKTQKHKGTNPLTEAARSEGSY